MRANGVKRGRWLYVVAALLIAGSWIGNTWYAQANRLKGTVFLEHHIEVSPEEGGFFDLYYLEDIRPSKALSGIAIEGYPGLQVTPYPNYAQYPRQTMGKMMVSSTDPETEQAPEVTEPIVIKEITALYHDGSSEKVRIGEIHIVPGAEGAPDRNPVQWTSGGGSSDHKGYNKAAIQRPVRLTGLSSAYLDMVKAGDLRIHAEIMRNIPGMSHRMEGGGPETKIELTGESILNLRLPVELNKGDSVKVAYQFSLSTRQQRMQVYQLQLRLEYEEDDRTVWHSGHAISYFPSPTEREVAEYVRERRNAL